MPLDTPTTKGNLLAQLVESVGQQFAGLRAWEQFGTDVKGYLEAKGLWDDFGDYQRKAVAARQSRARLRAAAAPAKTATRPARRPR